MADKKNDAASAASAGAPPDQAKATPSPGKKGRFDTTLESPRAAAGLEPAGSEGPKVEEAADGSALDITPTVPRSTPPRPTPSTPAPRPDSVGPPRPDSSADLSDAAAADDETTQRVKAATGTPSDGPPRIPSMKPPKKAARAKKTTRKKKASTKTSRARGGRRKTVTIPDDNAGPNPASSPGASGPASQPKDADGPTSSPPASSQGKPESATASPAAAKKEQAPGIYADENTITVLRPVQVVSDLPAVESKRPAAPPRPAHSEHTPDIEIAEDETIEEIEPERMSLPGLPPPASATPPGSGSPPPKPPPRRNKPTPPPRAGAAPVTETSPPQRNRPWFEELFDSDLVKTLDNPKAKDVEHEANFIEGALQLPKGSKVLDLGCGPAVHAITLAKRGYDVVGLDLSPTMLRLAKEFSAKSDQAIQLVKGDMRQLELDGAFDGIYCWSTTFGFFEPEENLDVLMRVKRALKPGGRFLLDIANRDFHTPRSPTMAWFQRPGVICMDEVEMNMLTSRIEVKRMAMFQTGGSREIRYSIRLYSLHEITGLLQVAGFNVLEVSGHRAHRGAFFDTESPRIILVCEKAADA